MPLPRAVAVVGTNASGKSEIGLRVAQAVSGEVLSADSRQVFEGFDLCSGKVGEEALRRVPHHLINVARVPERFTLFDYVERARQVLEQLDRTGTPAVLVGGTPLYAEAIVRGYSLVPVPPHADTRALLEERTTEELVHELDQLFPGESSRIGPQNRRRIVRALERARLGVSYAGAHEQRAEHQWLIFGVTWEPEELNRRIRRRLEERLDAGMVREVEEALADGAPRQFLWDLGLEYRQIVRYLDGEFASEAEFVDSLERAIRRFARRQMSWLRRWPDISWVSGSMEDRTAVVIEESERWLRATQDQEATRYETP